MMLTLPRQKTIWLINVAYTRFSRCFIFLLALFLLYFSVYATVACVLYLFR